MALGQLGFKVLDVYIIKMARLFCVIDCKKPVSPQAVSYITKRLKTFSVSVFVNNSIHMYVKSIINDLFSISDGSTTLLSLIEKVLKVGDTGNWADEEDTTLLIITDDDADQVSNVVQVKDLIKKKRLDDWNVIFMGSKKVASLLNLNLVAEC